MVPLDNSEPKKIMIYRGVGWLGDLYAKIMIFIWYVDVITLNPL